ncbi:c-type cytochrome [Gallaecimonas kandeliae]|uniref:c-type cytochrome n=1 Tax=Gallaecimonas kandeliae TaxID=3029055 RepID=UPI002649CF43|nr:c-type cytochrome [Gallaecimonas kandeliae]WKE64227.1 c-type cytochrome [Gallaecimonas kandeliae]
MKPLKMAVTLALGLVAGACSNTERSRNLDDPAVPAQAMAQQACALCHGQGGRSTNPGFPKLAGQQAPYLEGQLKAFRGKNRSDPAGEQYMWGLSKTLTDEQIAGLASYYAAQTPGAADAGADPALAAEGKTIFEKGVPEEQVPACNSCHGSSGQGNGVIPRIAGQHGDYLRKQLLIFQGTEQRPDGVAMKMVTHKLSDHQMQALAAYIQGLSAG